MRGLVCSICGFISIDGVAPEKCPVCGAPRTAFEDKEEAIKDQKDAANPSDLEKKHIPVILIVKKCDLISKGCQDAMVKIGEIDHPMQPEHYIMHIDFYLNKEFIARFKFTPDKLNPATALHLKVTGGKLSAIECCNLHGAWIREVDLSS